MSERSVLVVTSAGAPSGAVVPVLAALEAAGLRVRAIDVGGAGGGGGGMADRVRRALLGENAERRLRRELEASPPDAAVVFDPHAALALTVARDQVQNPAPVIAVVGELEPAPAWALTDADRFVAVDELAAVALADAGVEGDRILVVGAIGERAFADAATHERTALRTRFKLAGKVVLVEVAGLGPETAGQLAMQLSLLDGSEQITFLFDAATDADSAAVIRRQVPALGLRGKLFGQTADAALLWRAADVVIARPRPEVVARVMLAGAKLVAIIDDSITGAARASAALELRKRALPATAMLLLASRARRRVRRADAEPDARRRRQPRRYRRGRRRRAPGGDRRAPRDRDGRARDRVRAASAAASAAAASIAAAGDLEDLGGGGGVPDLDAVPDAAELARLRTEVKARVAELTKAMMTARTAATDFDAQAKSPGKSGDDAAALSRKADGERARMHSLLGELATLERELAELDAQIKVAEAAGAASAASRRSGSGSTGSSSRSARSDDDLFDSGPSAPPPSIDDALDALKRKAGTTAAPRPPSPGAPKSSTADRSGRTAAPKKGGNVDDELAALKKKMATAPPKKK